MGRLRKILSLTSTLALALTLLAFCTPSANADSTNPPLCSSCHGFAATTVTQLPSPYDPNASASFTAWDQTGGHGMHQDVWWEARVTTVNGQVQQQVQGHGVGYCVNAGGPYNCTTVSGYFRFLIAQGSTLDLPVACGAAIGHGPCPTVFRKDTGWIWVVCDFASNRYMGGDLTANTGNNYTARVTGRTPDDYSIFICP